MLYLIEYECAHWCGGGSHCVVEADSVGDAEDTASQHMQEEMYELFFDEYSDEYSDEENEGWNDECAYTVNSIEPFDENHECWKYYVDPKQSQFFPKVN